MPYALTDDTDRMTDEAWRKKDDTRNSDVEQLFQLLADVKTFLDVDHNSDGTHKADVALSEFTGYALNENVSEDQSALAVDAYDWDLVVDFKTAAWDQGDRNEHFYCVPTFNPDSGQTATLEILAAHKAQAALDRGSIGVAYRKVVTGTALGTRRARVYGTQNPLVADRAAHRPTLFDATADGIGVLRPHYNQIYRGAVDLYTALTCYHNAASDGLSRLGLPYVFRGSDAFWQQLPNTDLDTVADRLTCTIGAHGGQPKVLLPNIVYSYGTVGGATDYHTVVVSRSAYDDTNAYVLFETVYSNLHVLYRHESLILCTVVDPDALTAPTLPTYSATNTWAEGDSTEQAMWARLRDNLENLLLRFEHEHEIYQGRHQLPLMRLKNASKLTGTATASGTIGNRTRTAIDTNSTTKYWWPPTLVGNAGSGICAASLCFDDTQVYLQLERLTSGSTNTFTYAVYRADD